MTLGTVVVTGANGQVGQQLLTALEGKCTLLIALVRNSVDLPATQVISDWLNCSQAKKAIREADAIVHLAGNLKPKDGNYVNTNVKTTEKLVSALNPDKKQPIVFLSYVGSATDSPNTYLATKAQAEKILQASGNPVTIFRCTHLIGSPSQPGNTAAKLLSNNGKNITILGSGTQKVNPIYLDDVVTAIISALHQKHDGMFEIGGLETWTMDEFVRLLNQDKIEKINHILPFIAKLLPLVLKDLPLPLIEVMMSDSLGNSEHFQETFKIPLTSLRQVWNRLEK